MSYDVLVVDDSDVTRAMIIKSLSLAKLPILRYFEAANGREALEILEDHWIDLVLADLNMPIMGGQELLKIMRASRQLADVPVIVVTSEHCTPEEIASSWKAASYVRKPFTAGEIRAAFAALLQAPEDALEKDWLLELFAAVLESVAFMFLVAHDDAEDPPPPGEFFRSRMSFSGAVSGVLSLTVPRMLAAQMAANAMGIEPDDPVALSHDADIVGELLNITCGHVVEALAGSEPIALEPPVVTRHDADKWRELTCDPMRVWCHIEGQPVMIGFGARTANA